MLATVRDGCRRRITPSGSSDGAQDNARLQVVCEYDARRALLARNAWAGAFASGIAFAASARGAFLHRRSHRVSWQHGSVSSPAALRRVGLSGSASPYSTPARQ